MESYHNSPPSRPLKVYAFDPTRGRALGNFMTVHVPYEKLEPGPVGRLLQVIDYDGTTDTYYRPVNLDDPNILLRNGIEPNESDPQFHQQMVYAVASETVKYFEYALGRPIRWKSSQTLKTKSKYLRIFPHAMREANAYYDSSLKALLFGYFNASKTDPGLNAPGQTVFKCLSHDIIAHETTHAIIDGIRDKFDELSSSDAPAFHEAFADIVALFQHFSYQEVLVDVIRRTGGRMYVSEVQAEIQPSVRGPVIQAELIEENPLVGLAKQFGDAMGMRKALRSALGTLPNSKLLDKYFEPHLRGSILVAAVFDAFFTIYVKRSADLMRIARTSGAAPSSGEIHPDLANRLSRDAAKAAGQFLTICIRSIDYLPVTDITFGDFLRAIITADYDLVDNDYYGYRAAIIEAFRSRGITVEGVASYSEESLLWRPPEAVGGKELPICEGLKFDTIPSKKVAKNQEHDDEFWKQYNHNKEILIRFAKENSEILGLKKDSEIELHFNKVYRVGPDGNIRPDVICQLIQQREVQLDPKNPKSAKFKFFGGTTLILSQKGKIRYAIKKPLCEGKNDAENIRLQNQRNYLTKSIEIRGMAAYLDLTKPITTTIDFGLVHRGY